MGRAVLVEGKLGEAYGHGGPGGTYCIGHLETRTKDNHHHFQHRSSLSLREFNKVYTGLDWIGAWAARGSTLHDAGRGLSTFGQRFCPCHSGFRRTGGIYPTRQSLRENQTPGTTV